LIPSDKCGVESVKVFHLYKGFNRKSSRVGDFVKCSVQKTIPNNWIKKKTKLKGLIIRSKFSISNLDGTIFRFKENNVILLKKRLSPKGKEVVGPAVKAIRRKKFVASFAGAL
jgi:large subunit ribosomal protein L14